MINTNGRIIHDHNGHRKYLTEKYRKPPMLYNKIILDKHLILEYKGPDHFYILEYKSCALAYKIYFLNSFIKATNSNPFDHIEWSTLQE